MTANRKLVWMIVMLVVVVLAMSPALNAKGGGAVTLHRGGHEAKAGSRPSSFGGGTGGAINADICASGYCDCSACVCYGDPDCCDFGCSACWAYRDSQGYCAV